MFSLLEDNKNIDSLVSHLNKLIVSIRESGKLDPKIINHIKEMYDNSINKWMKDYLLNKEIRKQEEQIMIDKILDLINILEKLK